MFWADCRPDTSSFRISDVNQASQSPDSLPEKASKTWLFLEWIIPVFLAGRMISLWLTEFGLLPDSTFYLCAAMNLIRTGELIVYTNFPSFDFEPVMEIYSEYPPGFPLYLTPFVWIFKDPLLAGAIAQAVSILGIFLVAVPLFRALGFHWLLRLSGYAFLAFFISFREVFKILFSESTFLWTTLGTYYFAVRVSHPNRNRPSDWIFGLLLLAAGTSIKFIGLFNLCFWILPVLLSRRLQWTKGFAALTCASAPAALWLGRNYFLFEKLTRTHLEDWSQDPRSLLDPFLRTISVIAYNQWIVAGGLVILLALPLFFYRVLKRQGSPVTKRHLPIYLTTLFASLSHLLGIALLSTLLRMDFLDHRLLSPSYLMIGISLLFAVSLLSLTFAPYTRVLLFLPFLYMGTNPSFRNPLPDFNLTHFDRPAQERLWKELIEIDDLQGSTHFYTNIDFLHQLFCIQPHKIIWNENYADTPEKTEWLLQYGSRPYFVISDGDPLVDRLASQQKELGLVQKKIGDFTVFYRSLDPVPE